MLKGVVGCGWVRCLGCGWVVIVDRRAGMKWVVGRGSTAEVGGWSLVVVGLWSWLGRGWVVAEVALMMIFLNGFASVGFKSAGFQISGVSF